MNLTAVDELLTTTRSVRRRLDLARPVERSVIQQCLELAVQVPTGGDNARYHFVVVTDPAKRGELAKLYRHDGFAALGPDCGPPTFYGSILPATWSLMLALRSRGLGSAWTTSHLKYAHEAAVLLGIPDDITRAARFSEGPK